MQTTDTPCSAGQSAASAELAKQQRKQKRKEFLEKIRDSLGTVIHQMAFSPAEAGIVCGRSPTWAYRRIYAGKFRVTKEEDGRLQIPRSEIERYLGGAEKYNQNPKAKIGGGGNGRH